MIARFPGSEPGWVKQIVQVPVPGVERVQGMEVPRRSVPALVRVLVVFAPLVPEVLLPTSILA
jgi:hypothetical protein